MEPVGFGTSSAVQALLEVYVHGPAWVDLGLCHRCQGLPRGAAEQHDRVVPPTFCQPDASLLPWWLEVEV